MIDRELFLSDPLLAVGFSEKESLELLLDFYDREIEHEPFSGTSFFQWLVQHLEDRQYHFRLNESPFIKPVLLNIAWRLFNYDDPEASGFSSEPICEKLYENASIPFVAELLDKYIIKGDWRYRYTQTFNPAFLFENQANALQEEEYFEELKSDARLTYKQACSLIAEALCGRLVEAHSSVLGTGCSWDLSPKIRLHLLSY